MNAKTATTIDRKTAGKLLGVSVRTIDRYIRRGKLFAREENGRICLDKKDILNFRSGEKFFRSTPPDTRQPVRLSTTTPRMNDDAFYRDLYDEAKRALHEYQQKLEASNYRIGQLESQITSPLNSQPIERREDSFSRELMRKELRDREKEAEILKDLVKKERSAKIIFAVLTYILLGLLPLLWFFLRTP